MKNAQKMFLKNFIILIFSLAPVLSSVGFANPPPPPPPVSTTPVPPTVASPFSLEQLNTPEIVYALSGASLILFYALPQISLTVFFVGGFGGYLATAYFIYKNKVTKSHDYDAYLEHLKYVPLPSFICGSLGYMISLTPQSHQVGKGFFIIGSLYGLALSVKKGLETN